MDPDAALKELLEAVKAGGCDRVRELADGLKHWLSQGGFPPKTIGTWKLGQVWHVALTHAVIVERSWIRFRNTPVSRT